MRWSTLYLALLAAALLAACGEPAGEDLGMMSGPDMGPLDPCLGVSNCDTAGFSCSGETLVECASDGSANECLVVTSEVECDNARGGFCDDSGAVAECAIDECELVENPCIDVGARVCQGDVLVECALDENGCRVETRTSCSDELNGFCDSSGEVAACITPQDPCADLPNTCLLEGSSCDGDSVVECAPNGFGCLVETVTDCTLGGSTASCVRGGQGALCNRVTRPCEAIPGNDVCTIEDEGAVCDGPVLTQCERDAFGCFRETALDCTSVTNGFCNTSALTCEVSRTNLCAGVPQCEEIGRSCNGSNLVVCARDPRGCQVEIVTDCPAEGDLCDDEGEVAICAPSTCPQAPTVIDCTAGTITADTADGTDFFNRYIGDLAGSDPVERCTVGDRHAGNEFGFTFRNENTTRVTFDFAPTGEVTENYDVFVLAGENERTDCNEGTICLATGRDETASESVTVDLMAGEEAYVFYDVFGIIATETTEFELTVTCAEPVCGDGVLGAFEECDDGGVEVGDGCSDTCTLEDDFECFSEPSVCNLVCSNGRLDGFESCDDGNADAGDGCSPECRIEDFFECDESEPSICTRTCGNGTLNADELCDDGNAIDFDGCSSGCEIEDGATCDTAIEPSDCTPSDCGNGVVDAGEACDDGNNEFCDGCSGACLIERDCTCTGDPSVCTCGANTCGDSVIDEFEACDDGNTVAGDGCTCCALDIGFVGSGITISGNLSGSDDIWSRRPNATPFSCSGTSTGDRYYDAVPVVNPTGVGQNLDVDVSWSGIDGYLLLYDNEFDPMAASALTGCISGDDDEGSTARSRDSSVNLDAGETIFVVLTAWDPFSALVTGDYDVDVDTN